jgi:alpha-1,6-mannosyltransferase
VTAPDPTTEPSRPPSVAGASSALPLVRRRLASVFGSHPDRPIEPFEGWGFLWRPAALGVLALVSIVVGSSFSNSPFKLENPGAWFFGVPTKPTQPLAPVNSATMLLGITLVYGGLVLLLRVWIQLAGIARRHPGAPLGRLGWILALWILPMLAVAPLFSRDVYSYAAQGEMVTRHLNPYQNGPYELGSGPFPGAVDPLWRYVPAPYGPLFLSMDGWIVQLVHHNHLWSILGLRLLEVGAVALLAVSIPVLARGLGYDPGHAFVLCVLNPLVVLTVVGGAHNDGLMVALLVAGLALAVRKHPVWGIVVCALAASIKAPAALGIVYIAWEWLGPNLRVRLRLRPLAVAGLLTAGVLGACTFVSGLGYGWVRNLNTPGAVRSWAAPATGLGMGLAALGRGIGLDVSTTWAISLTRFLGLAIAGVLIVWLLFNADRIGWLKALGYSLLALVVLGPVVQPWYLTWGLLLLAVVATGGRLRAWVIGLSVVSPFVGLPGGHKLLTAIVHAPMIETGVVLFLLWCVLFAPLGGWTSYAHTPLVDATRRSEQALQLDDVEPPAVLAADLALHADELEATRGVQAD